MTGFSANVRQCKITFAVVHVQVSVYHYIIFWLARAAKQLVIKAYLRFWLVCANRYLGGFSKRYPLKLYKKASFCHKKAKFQTAVASACLLQNQCVFLQKTGNRKIFLFNSRNISRAFFLFSKNALETLYYSVILTATSGQVLF